MCNELCLEDSRAARLLPLSVADHVIQDDSVCRIPSRTPVLSRSSATGRDENVLATSPSSTSVTRGYVMCDMRHGADQNVAAQADDLG